MDIPHLCANEQDFLHNGELVFFVTIQVALAENVVIEHVPGRHRDQFARGDHTGGSVDHTFDQHRLFGVVLRNHMRNDVLARGVAARRDGRGDVLAVEFLQLQAEPQLVQQGRSRKFPAWPAAQHLVQACSLFAIVAVGQADDFGGDVDCELEGDDVEFGARGEAWGEAAMRRPLRGSSS